MAEDNDNPFEGEGAEAAGGSSSHLTLIIRIGLMVAVMGIGAAGGYGLGGLFAASPPPDANQPAVEPPELPDEDDNPPDVADRDFEYIDFEAITANLNEPRLARYIRSTITLAIRNKDHGQVFELLDTKNRKKELRNWLTVYLSGLTLEDVRGPKKLNRIRREIQESFNQQLWPNRRPLIDHVLFKEFAVQ